MLCGPLTWPAKGLELLALAPSLLVWMPWQGFLTVLLRPSPCLVLLLPRRDVASCGIFPGRVVVVLCLGLARRGLETPAVPALRRGSVTLYSPCLLVARLPTPPPTGPGWTCCVTMLRCPWARKLEQKCLRSARCPRVLVPEAQAQKTCQPTPNSAYTWLDTHQRRYARKTASSAITG